MLDCRILERNFQHIAATEIGLNLLAAYVTEVISFLGADCCHIVQERDEWTATVTYSSVPTVTAHVLNPGQLIEFTRDNNFFHTSSLSPKRSLKLLVGGAKQLSCLRLKHYAINGWVIIGWETTNELAADDIENALYRFGDKVLINYLTLQRITLEQQYRFLFSVVPQAVVLVNESDKVSWVNQAAIELLQLEPDELRPSSASIAKGMTQLRSQALNQDDISTVAAELLQKPGFVASEWIWIFPGKVMSILTRPIFSPYFKGRIWLFNDVTELYQKNQQLTDANREIENLISVIAHDLKSPLATLSFVFNFLPMHGPLNEEQTENIEYGQKTIKRGLNLIDSIVYFNRLITSQQPVQMDDIELNDLLAIVVDGFAAQAYQKDITLHIQTTDQPVILHSDPESLVRILDNLISNALKFSSFGRNVYITTEWQANHLFLAVRDEGPGISPEDQAKLFKRFQRLSAQPTNNEGSSGLGLSIVKALTEKLGATIDVASTLTVGTTFRLAFPATYVRLESPASSAKASH